MPKDALQTYAEYLQHKIGRGVRVPMPVAGVGEPGLRPEGADPITENDGGSTVKIFCCDFDTVDGSEAIVR